MIRFLLSLMVFLLNGTQTGDSGKHAVEMVKIPGGEFLMGSESMRNREKPVHRVRISAFYMGKTEITVGQFRVFIAESGYRTEAEKENWAVVFTGKAWEKRPGINWRNPGFAQNDSHPVTCLSWNDCHQYIAWLNRKTGMRYRLPTETEWEFAAKDEDRAEIDSIAWFEGNAGGATHPVGCKLANQYGLNDMIGNVWEWCSDWFGLYGAGFQTNPTGPKEGEYRVNRGGAWYGANLSCRKRRGKNTPDDRGNGLGFRLAADDY